MLYFKKNFEETPLKEYLLAYQSFLKAIYIGRFSIFSLALKYYARSLYKQKINL